MDTQTRVPHTLTDVNVELIRVAAELDDVTDKLIEADTRATKLRATADFADTAAFLGAEGKAMDLRRMLGKDAARAAGDWDARVAESEVRHARAKIKALELRLESLQSVGANIKAEAKVVGHGYGAGS
jgi:hypothetical protein